MTETHEALSPDLARSLELREHLFERTGTQSSRARERLRDQVAELHFSALVELDGLGLSPGPSARYSSVRMVEASRLPAEHRELFARPSAAMPELAAAFVDPAEFSYRNFENILPLDRYFAGLELELGFDARKPLGEARDVQAYGFALSCSEAVRGALQGLDGLNLYVEPLNASSRGGRRFIFHSAALAEALDAAVRAALPKRWLKGFAHVNPVFRCNRFVPGDAPFRRHVDTPYFDRARGHISRYTLLIYLSGGESGDPDSPALEIGEDIELCELPAMSCVLFGQDQPHAGAPFAKGRKVFLRTELIFEAKDEDLREAPELASLFAKACYLSGEATLRPELGPRMHELYDRAAAAHWSGELGEREAEPEPHFHKRFRGAQFVTNGHDYWFAKGHLELRECAALVLLDLLNCKIGGEAFRTQIQSRVLTPAGGSRSEWAFSQLEGEEEGEREPLFTPAALDDLLPESEPIAEDMCCPFHCMMGWDATRHSEVVDLYEHAQEYVRRRVRGVPISMMGQELHLQLDNIVVGAGKIHVLSEHALEPLNFAACWNDGSTPSNYLAVETEFEALHLLVPPLLFVEHARGYHLMVDLFRNAWMVEEARRVVPVPRIQNMSHEGDWDEFCAASPWLRAASVGMGGEQEEIDEDEQWWEWEDSPLGELPEYGQSREPEREELELFGKL